MLKKKLIFTSVAIFGVSCVSGPKDESRTVADRMNGENYQSTNVLMGVPILERKTVERKLSGKVFCGEGLSQVPVNHAMVSLIQKGQIVRTTSTFADGSYHLAGPIDPNFEFRLSASANCGQGSRTFEKNLKADVQALDLFLKK